MPSDSGRSGCHRSDAWKKVKGEPQGRAGRRDSQRCHPPPSPRTQPLGSRKALGEVTPWPPVRGSPRLLPVLRGPDRVPPSRGANTSPRPPGRSDDAAAAHVPCPLLAYRAAHPLWGPVAAWGTEPAATATTPHSRRRGPAGRLTRGVTRVRKRHAQVSLVLGPPHTRGRGAPRSRHLLLVTSFLSGGGGYWGVSETCLFGE